MHPVFLQLKYEILGTSTTDRQVLYFVKNSFTFLFGWYETKNFQNHWEIFHHLERIIFYFRNKKTYLYQSNFGESRAHTYQQITSSKRASDKLETSQTSTVERFYTFPVTDNHRCFSKQLVNTDILN